MAEYEKRFVERVSTLKQMGLNYTQIGKRLGVSKQRVHSALNRAAGTPATAHMAPSRVKTMLTTQEAAELLGVHINTVRRWSDTGKLVSCRIGSRRDRRFPRSEIEKMLGQASTTGRLAVQSR